ncbi:MAG: MFS transporter [Gemmatales bacterium]|nr:MFS transporter [Gemmatales bacterium]MDW7994368.1 MFS transporter [Gemmatales bacterium]
MQPQVVDHGVRYRVLAFLCVLSMITYLDRVAMGAAAPAIAAALFGPGTGVEVLKWAFTAFTFAYAAFEVPSGWLGDVFGPKRTLIRIVLWWSAFTALTGFTAWEIVQGRYVFGTGEVALLWLIAIRFLFGVGEAGAYPNITRALHNWMPLSERGRAQGAIWFSGRLMGGLTPLIWVLLVEWFLVRALGLSHDLSWRVAFWIFGGLGVIWCLAFAAYFSDRPEQHPQVSQGELDFIQLGRLGEESAHAGVPWLQLLTDRNLWTLCLMYFCAAFGWYFHITYLPGFLERHYNVPKESLLGGLFKGGPLIFGALGCIVGGWLTDAWLRRTGDRTWARRRFGILGHLLCAACFPLCIFAPWAWLFALCISLAAFWNDITMGPSWAICQDIGKRYAAIVAGCMNTIGNLGGAAANLVTGTIVEWTKHYLQNTHPSLDAERLGYNLNFVLFSAVYLTATVLWFFIDATKPVAGQRDFDPEHQAGRKA